MDEREIGKGINGGNEQISESAAPTAGGIGGTHARPGPTWRGWAISILAAVILSVAATVIFGGPSLWSGATAVPKTGGCGGPCCAAAGK